MPGNLELEFRFKGAGPAARRRAGALRVLVLGNFSGHAHRYRTAPGALTERAVLSVDVDNFERIMGHISPRLALARGQTGGAGLELTFHELEDFHPDTLYRRLDLFQALRVTRARLVDPATFAETAAQLTSAPPGQPAASAGPVTREPKEDDAATLERLLGAQPPVALPAATGSTAVVTQLIRDIVAPYIVPGADPRQALYLQWLDESVAAQMRAVLHHPDFQALESAWRSLHDLVSRVETDETLRLFVLDVTKAELAGDLNAAGDDLQRSELFRLLMANGPEDPGGEPWSLLVGDFAFGPDDAGLLAALGAIGSAIGGPLLAAATPQVLGCPSVVGLTDPSGWREPDTDSRWQALRASTVAGWVGLALPRLLLRLPYGENGEAVDAFAFEELPQRDRHETFLWGNPAFGLATLIAAAYRERGAAMQPGDLLDLEDRPAYTYVDDAGDVQMQPCAEVQLGERAMEGLLARGLIPCLSFRGRNAVRVARYQSLAAPLAALSGQWT